MTEGFSQDWQESVLSLPTDDIAPQCLTDCLGLQLVDLGHVTSRCAITYLLEPLLLNLVEQELCARAGKPRQSVKHWGTLSSTPITEFFHTRRKEEVTTTLSYQFCEKSFSRSAVSVSSTAAHHHPQQLIITHQQQQQQQQHHHHHHHHQPCTVFLFPSSHSLCWPYWLGFRPLTWPPAIMSVTPYLIRALPILDA